MTENGWPYWTAPLVAIAVGMVLGMVLESALLRRLTNRPLDAILVTLGLSLVLQQLLQEWYGAAPRAVEPPVKGTFELFGVVYPTYRLVVIGIALVSIAAASMFSARSACGTVVQAIFQNRESALTSGIKAGRYNRLAFGIGAALAVFAGSLIAPGAGVLPHMGTFYLGPAFIAVILGGSGRLLGAVIGALFMGGLEVLLIEHFSQTVARAGVLVLAIVLIRFRPAGLLPEPRIRVA